VSESDFDVTEALMTDETDEKKHATSQDNLSGGKLIVVHPLTVENEFLSYTSLTYLYILR